MTPVTSFYIRHQDPLLTDISVFYRAPSLHCTYTVNLSLILIILNLTFLMQVVLSAILSHLYYMLED